MAPPILKNGVFYLDKKRIHRESPVLPWAMLAVAVLSIVSLITPFGAYKYGSENWQVSGFDLLTGKDIMGGTVHIPASALIWIGVLLSVVIIAMSFVFRKIKVRLSGVIVLVSAFLQLVMGVLLLVTMTSILSETKKPAVAFGVYVYMLLAVANVVLAGAALYQNRVLNVLDFMVLPGLAYVIINNYLPMIGISLAFKKIDFVAGIWKSPWVGLQNFEFLFKSRDAFIITRNTLLYNICFIVLGNILGIIVGICLNEIFSKKLQKLFQTTILLPQLISMVIVAYIVYGFLSNEAGFINKTILDGQNTINFYGTKAYWPFILIFVQVWKSLGYNSIIYLSSAVGIDRTLYEAASIDGCSRMGAIRHITLPLLKSTVFTLVLLQVGRIFYSDFGLFYQVPMDSGSLYEVTDTIDTYVYRAMMKLNNLSMASAASAYQAIVGFVIVLTFNVVVRKVSRENALF